MYWEKALDLDTKEAVRYFKTEPKALPTSQYDPALNERISYIENRTPWLKPETTLALAKTYATPEAIDVLGEMAAKRDIDQIGTQSQLLAGGLGALGTGLRYVGNVAGFGWHWLGKGLKVVPGALQAVEAVGDSLYQTGQLFKTPVKYGTAALDIVPEMSNYLVAKLIGEPFLAARGRPIEHYNPATGGFWDQFSIGQLLKNPDESGDGFFISEEMRQAQAAEARARRGTINGSAFTLGRGAAALVFDPNSQAYANVSGVIDVIWNLKLPDPTKLFSKGAEALRLAKGVTPLISQADRPSLMRVVQGGTHFEHVKTVDAVEAYLTDIRKARFADDAAAELHAQAGLSSSLAGGSVDFQQFTKFMKTNPSAQVLTKQLINEDRAGAIFKDIFNGEITTDLAYDLSLAKTEDEVIGVLTGAYQYGEGTLSRRIADYAGKPFFSQKNPLFNGLRRSRAFTEVPNSFVVVSGDNIDNMKAVRNMANSMIAAGVSKAEVDDWMDGAVKAFRSTSTSRDIFETRRVYQDAVKKSLVRNGISSEVIDEVMRVDRDGIDKMRKYFVDRMGIPTDNGLLTDLLSKTAAYLDPEEVSRTIDTFATAGGGFGYDLTFGSPVQYADMLNRVQVLPDPRQLRRLSRNSIMTKYLSKIPVGQDTGVAAFRKAAIVSKKAKRDIEVITDKAKMAELTAEESRIMASMDPINKDPKLLQDLSDIRSQMDRLKETVTKRVITGEQRGWLYAAEWVQNGLWKPFTLMTGGYTMRNMIDAQVRIAFGGLSGALNHPLEYISLVAGRKMSKSILGEDIVGGGWKRTLGEKGGINAEDMRKELRDVLTAGGRIRGMSESDYGAHMYKTGSWADVSRGDSKSGLELHTDGMVQQLGKIYSDELQRVAVRGLAAGKSEEDIVNDVVSAIRANPEYYNEVSKIYSNGLEYISSKTGTKSMFPRFNITDIGKDYGRSAADEILKAHARKIVLANVDQVTGKIPELHFAAAFDHTPRLDAMGQMVRIQKTEDQLKLVLGGNATGKEVIEFGRKVTTDDGIDAIVIGEAVSDGSKIFTVVPIDDAHVMSAYRGGSRSLKSLLKRTPIYDNVTGVGIPQIVRREIIGTHSSDAKGLAYLQENMDKATNWFFSQLNEFESRKLERSPVFRQYYYKHISEHIGKLSQAEADSIIKDLTAKASAMNMSIADYIGDAKIAQRKAFTGRAKQKTFLQEVEKVAKEGGEGTLTAKELDDFARFRAIGDTQNLLFDASSTNNFKDAMRVIVPFGNAWNEVIARYLKFAAYDGVHAYRSFQRVYNGAVNADPDKDGRGLFYKDPQTGDMMFMFPASATLSKIITGGEYATPLSAPVKRLSQGIQVYPSIGPMVQFAASQYIPDIPEYDAWVKLLMPYGRSQKFSEAVGAPGWAKKLYEVAKADTNNLGSTFFNTFAETMRAEGNTGNYDLSDPLEIQRLKDNAKSKARWLSLLRVASQFVGPTSGGLEFKIPTADGDAYAKELIKEFSDMQNEDYDSAVERFLKLHGNNAALYIAAKSKAQQPGLEATDEFGDWQRENGDIISAYPRVANYIAPTGDGFDFVAQERQLRKGQRKRQTADEMIADAQNRIGASRYRAAKKVFGPYPTESEREQLATYREYLNNKYPGFPARAEFVTNQYLNDIDDLAKLVNDPRVIGNPVIDSIKEYLELRQRTIDASGYKTLNPKSMTNARAELFRAGEALASSNPYFDRIWQRLLLREVED